MESKPCLYIMTKNHTYMDMKRKLHIHVCEEEKHDMNIKSNSLLCVYAITCTSIRVDQT